MSIALVYERFSKMHEDNDYPYQFILCYSYLTTIHLALENIACSDVSYLLVSQVNMCTFWCLKSICVPLVSEINMCW